MQGFHVATFNLENLNRPGVFYVERDDPPFDNASFETKCNWIGSILDEGAVDLAASRRYSVSRPSRPRCANPST